MTRQFIYSEFSPDIGNVDTIIGEEDIIQSYWGYWSEAMLRVGKSPLITSENCIQDFCVIHWATQLPEDEVNAN